MSVRRTAAVLLTSAALATAGMAAAYAATTGSVSLSRPGTSFAGTYKYYCPVHLRTGQTGVCIQGSLKTWSGQAAHLNDKTPGRASTQLARRTTNGATAVSQLKYDGSVFTLTSVTLQLCHERPIWDDCIARTYNL